MWANRTYLVYCTDTLFVFVASYLWSQCAGTNIIKQNPYYLENHTLSHIHKYYKKCEFFSLPITKFKHTVTIVQSNVCTQLFTTSLSHSLFLIHTYKKQAGTKCKTPHDVDVKMIAQTHTIFHNKHYLLNVVLPICSHRTLCDMGLLGVFWQI